MTAEPGTRQGLRDLVRTPAILVGLGILAVFVLAAAAHPVLMETVWNPRVHDPVVGFALGVEHPSGPSAAHPLGTDSLGRDVLSMLTYATRDTLAVALTAAGLTAAVALLVGSVSSFWGGRVDTALSSVSDAMLLLPAPIVMIAFGLARPGLFGPVAFGTTYGLIAGLGGAAVTVRSYGLSVMARPFIDAARVSGCGPWHIISRHLLPHLLPLAATLAMLSVTGAVVASGFVDYLTPGRTDRVGLGSLVYSGLTYQAIVGRDVAWSVLLSGALSISLVCAAFYLLGVGLRQRLDPTDHHHGLPRPANPQLRGVRQP
jgi:peptide/nickel transport system permease protein